MVIDKAKAKIVKDKLEAARDASKVFNDFFSAVQAQKADGTFIFNETHLRYLDQGIDTSPFRGEINQYPERLKQKIDNVQVVSLGDKLQLSNDKTVAFSPYPTRGNLPTIDEQGLKFLDDPDIKQVCVCVGSSVNGQIKAHWLGKNALEERQFWSTTKIVPVLHIVDKANAVQIGTKIANCTIQDSSGSQAINFEELAIDIVSYQKGPDNSNRTASMFKRFNTLEGLEKWFKGITGNSSLQFRGYYGKDSTGFPFLLIESPELHDTTNRILSSATATPEKQTDSDQNLVSAYDLTRIISMLGWHHHIGDTKLPNSQWHSLEAVVRAMGYDTARYVDAAIDKLGLKDVISSPVIISKLGAGASSQRNQSELAYVAFVQFIDHLPEAEGKPAKLRTFSMALRGEKQKSPRNPAQEARSLDATMVATVTEILRRIVSEELA